jgi:ABC-type antimicrobial peptide transport system, ATPase component
MGILKLIDVSYSYQNQYQTVEAVKNVSLEVELGKVHAIIGKSGSGKSTLLSLMAGLTLPKSGDILYEGESIQKVSLEEYRRDKASVIYQTFNLFPLMTVLEKCNIPPGIKRHEAC